MMKRDCPLRNRRQSLANRINHREFRREAETVSLPPIQDWFEELASHGGLWNYWRDEDEFVAEMNERFGTDY